MELKWDKEQIRFFMSNIQQKTKTDSFDKTALLTYGSYLSNARQEKEKRAIKDSEQLIGKIKIICDEFNYYNDRYLSKKISQQLLNLVDCLGLLYFNPRQQDEYQITKKKTNPEELVKQSYDIFTNLSPKFKKQLDYIYNHNLVEFNQKKSKFYEPCFCLPDLHNKVGNVYVDEEEANVFTVAGTYNHELTHSITCMINPNILKKDKMYVLTEAHPIYTLLYTNNANYHSRHELDYLKANDNYLAYLRGIVCELKVILCLSELEDITKDSIENALVNKFNLEILDLNMFLNKYANIDVFEDFMYLLSGVCALHLLDQDEDKSKELYTDTLFHDTHTLYKFFQKIDFDLVNEYSACDLFNRSNCESETKIRNHTRKRQ